MAAIEPMEQFMVRKVVDLPPIPVPGLGALDMSITNSVLFMLIAAGLISTFFLLSARRQIVPGRMQAVAEMLYNLVDSTLTGGVIALLIVIVGKMKNEPRLKHASIPYGLALAAGGLDWCLLR